MKCNERKNFVHYVTDNGAENTKKWIRNIKYLMILNTSICKKLVSIATIAAFVEKAKKKKKNGKMPVIFAIVSKPFIRDRYDNDH